MVRRATAHNLLAPHRLGVARPGGANAIFFVLFLCGGGAHQCINEWMENRSQIDPKSMKNHQQSSPSRSKTRPGGRFGLLGGARGVPGDPWSEKYRKVWFAGSRGPSLGDPFLRHFRNKNKSKLPVAIPPPAPSSVVALCPPPDVTSSYMLVPSGRTMP